MARLAVVNAVLNRLGPLTGPADDPKRYWQPSSGDPVLVVGPNETGDADPAGGRFITVQFPVANEEMRSIGDPGNNLWVEEGVIRLVIGAERNAGLNQALAWADELASLFRGQSFDGVQCWAVTSPQMDDRNEESGYYRVPLAIGFEHTLFG
ncbi:phage tail terminator-like protein [Enterovirga rhinocerotis]|uniref:Uncharacterized protein DUF4128 n=1 Tax=Enterovirga rhinocerotis TaxID=1339210 RepID=A0A4R7BZU1_9HYPH|nr:phage tail terminator-like protein [Enterovirga rhinocerotis]TDR90295.1 uncharacterized protein DUF4128 [Enterovirga rhinocerotis]